MNFRPEICAAVQLIAPGAEQQKASSQNFYELEKVIKHLKETPEDGISFVPIGMDTAKLIMFLDASFANAPDLKSQLGYVI